jgi:hypothetical protein
MKIRWFWGAIGLGSLLIMLAGISPAVGESNKLGGTERPVMEALETQFAGTPSQVAALDSFHIAPAASPEAVDWAGAMEPSGAVGTGVIPAPVPEDDLDIPEERWLEDHYPD